MLFEPQQPALGLEILCWPGVSFRRRYVRPSFVALFFRCSVPLEGFRTLVTGLCHFGGVSVFLEEVLAAADVEVVRLARHHVVPL